MPLNFLSAIYNGEISLKEAEFKQRDFFLKIKDLEFGYKSKTEKKKEKSQVFIHANELLECRDEIIKAFKDGIFLSEHLKKSDDAAYNHVLKNVNEFTEEIKSMEEKINLSLFEDFFGFSSPADYAKMLINTKNQDKYKECVEEIEDRISDLEERIEKKSEKEKKIKMRMRH